MSRIAIVGARSPRAFLRNLLLPVTQVTLIVTILAVGVICTVLLPGRGPADFDSIAALVLRGGLLAMPMLALTAIGLLNYGFVLLESTANGRSEPPALAIEALNPAHDWRPILWLLVLLGIGTATSTLMALLGRPVAMALAVLAGLALPAVTAELALSSNLITALNPRVLWRTTASLGASYVGLVLVLLGYGAAAIWLCARPIGWWWFCTGVAFAWLSFFTLLGGCLYEHRLELEHEPAESPERRAEREHAAFARVHERIIDRLHVSVRSGHNAAAWRVLEQELADRDHAPASYAWLFDELIRRGAGPIVGRLAQAYIDRVLGRDNDLVVRIAQRALAVDPTFRPRSGAQCLRVAELLRIGGDRHNAVALLRDFAQRFPADPAVADAADALAALLGRA